MREKENGGEGEGERKGGKGGTRTERCAESVEIS